MRNFYRKKITRLSKHYDVAVGCVVGECTYFVNDLVSADKKLCGYIRTMWALNVIEELTKSITKI